MFKRVVMSLILCVIAIPAFAYMYAPSSGDEVVVTSAGTPVQFSNTTKMFYSMDVCASKSNVGNVVVGSSNVVAADATRNGIVLTAGDCRSFSGPNNQYNGDASAFYVNAKTNNDSVEYDVMVPYGR